jgi:hypothetical protein
MDPLLVELFVFEFGDVFGSLGRDLACAGEDFAVVE